MKKALILLGDGFEQIEALTPHDIFLRSRAIKPVLCSLTNTLTVTSSSGLKVQADSLLKDVEEKDFDFIVLPGGKLGVENISASEKSLKLIKEFAASGKGIYAICAAPSILARLGLLDERRYTCFPGFENGKGEYRKELTVIEDGEFITARSMAYSLKFAEAIIKKELGDEYVTLVHPGTKGLPYPQE